MNLKQNVFDVRTITLEHQGIGGARLPSGNTSMEIDQSRFSIEPSSTVIPRQKQSLKAKLYKEEQPIEDHLEVHKLL